MASVSHHGSRGGSNAHGTLEQPAASKRSNEHCPRLVTAELRGRRHPPKMGEGLSHNDAS
jgi:hypothetical protein